MAEWDALPRDILILIAKHIEIFEDTFIFYAVCKSWHSVKSILGKIQTNLPSRFPWVMLTDKAEINFPIVRKRMNLGKMLMGEVRKNEQIEGMHSRQFFSFSASKAYEFELPEATRKKCFGLGFGLLLTIGYDLQINILNPFTRQEIGMPSMLSFKESYEYNDKFKPQEVVNCFVTKVAISSNPYNPSHRDYIVVAIYGEQSLLAFARPGDKVWTDILPSHNANYVDVDFYKGKVYAVDTFGIIYVCDVVNDANELKATPIACDALSSGRPLGNHHGYHKYLVESSGDLLLVVRFRKGIYYDNKRDINKPYNYTTGFAIFKLEECCHGTEISSNNLPYRLTEVKNLGNKALFIGNNASVSVPCSRFVKANSIYFTDNEVIPNFSQPYGGGYDTGTYDVESGNVSLHEYASKFMSHLTPPTWIIT